MLLGTILFFQLVNLILKIRGPPNSLKNEEWKWRNIYVSWLHALTVSVWALLSMTMYPELFHDPMHHINLFTYFNACWPTGYFMYDFLDMLLNGKLVSSWEVTLHHIVVGGMFYWDVHYREKIGFIVMAMMIEFNSVFLHWRKLLQMVGVAYNSRHYLIIKYLNLVTFVFRFGGVFLITGSIYVFGDQVTAIYWWGISFAMLFMNILNVILFRRLFRSDILRGADGRRASVMDTLRGDWANIVNNSSRCEHSCEVKHGGLVVNSNDVLYQENDLKED